MWEVCGGVPPETASEGRCEGPIVQDVVMSVIDMTRAANTCVWLLRRMTPDRSRGTPRLPCMLGLVRASLPRAWLRCCAVSAFNDRSRYGRSVSRRYFRPGALVGHVLVLAAALTCLRLGWWQWEVFGAARGTGQNLGYALLWPVFSGSFIYMWLRFLQLESTRDIVDAGSLDAGSQDAGSQSDDTAVVGDDLGTSLPYAVSSQPDDSTETIDTRHRRFEPATGTVYTVGVGYVGDDDDDPELAAYNRALAQLAEQDERGAR